MTDLAQTKLDAPILPRFVTVGCFGATETQFFGMLTRARVSHLVDMRRRRGVRGREYAFVNHKRLTERLEALAIRYHHALELAPTPELRALQKAEDNLQGETKRTRQGLGEAFCRAYIAQHLTAETLKRLIETLPDLDRDSVVALFCVESHADACHRSLVARHLEQSTGSPIVDLIVGRAE